ncbi:hypothetical protein VB620_06165 [Nodularia harveyana UHCC-0300]|uniref:Uncharacterized protein n=1 Tax=Nodularia harveyana UHCC-0300 TaxID=2974287 RepID=A0ABU5UC70_9CYAN|nr:hypothetical protein [Nodularia harveyana]MEA5580923.1 hypothetical protein [Nodularia harveyana UHCC-0300]
MYQKNSLAATASVLALKFSLGACVTEKASEISGDTATSVDFDPSDVAMTDKARSF